MQFETRIINGKPSIFFKEETSTKSGGPVVSKKTNTSNKNIRNRNNVLKSISGENDYVQPSPRSLERPLKTPNPENLSQAQINSLNKKLGLKLNKKQLSSILNTVLVTDRPNESTRLLTENRKEALNLDLNERDEIQQHRYGKNRDAYYEDDVKLYRQPHVVVNEELEEPVVEVKKSTNLVNSNSAKSSLIEQKRQKWQQEQDAMDKMHQQEKFDLAKGVQMNIKNNDQAESAFYNGNPTSNRTKIITNIANSATTQQQIPHKSTMTLAEKKRIEWQKERENSFPQQSLNKQKSISDLTRIAKEPNHTRNDVNILAKSNSLNDILNHLENTSANESQRLPQRYSLMEKKQLKWNQDFQENYDPYGKPGVGVGPIKTNTASNIHLQLNTQNIETADFKNNLDDRNKPVNYTNNTNAKTQKYRDSLEEYRAINDTLAQIIEAENKIKAEQIEILKSQLVNQPTDTPINTNSSVIESQKMVPAAMRTSIMFGNVTFDDEIKRAKELERQKWLADLEAQKKEKQINIQRKKIEEETFEMKKQNEIRQSWNSPRRNQEATQTVSTNNYQSNTSMVNDQSKVPSAMRSSFVLGGDPINSQQQQQQQHLQYVPTDKNNEQAFGRTRNLLDPAQLDELERRRNKSLQHKLDIEAQIAEKKRIKNLEDQVETLGNLKIENEAKKITNALNASEQQKQKQPQYHNFEKILATQNGPPTMASIMQGSDGSHNDQENQSSRNESDKSQDTFRRLQMAELAAAEEKHKRLLKRLKHGGHDTKNLENKFNDYRNKILSNINPELVSANTSSKNTVSDGLINGRGIEDQRNKNNTSMSIHPEAKLERQKLNLEKELIEKKIEENDGASFNNLSEQKIKQIFNLLREDTVGLPAEINEEQLKMILARVSENSADKSGVKNSKTGPQKPLNNKSLKNQPKPHSADLKAKIKAEESMVGEKKPGGKPIWNPPKPTAKPKMSNSEKDPFYHEKKALIEERRRKRADLHQAMVEKNNKKYQEFLLNSKKDHDEKKRQQNNISNADYLQRSGQHRQSIASSSHSTIDNYEDTRNSKPSQGESILNLLTKKNLSNNVIYEDDEDTYLRPAQSINQGGRNLGASRFSRNERDDLRVEDMGGSPMGFVPFMRTDEFLDPAHAGSPVPPSRESSAMKQDREKARQAYYKNQNPASYGHFYQDNRFDNGQQSNAYRSKDPLLNNGLVKSSPTPRQEQILSQLATLKQSLMQKQREVASSIQVENNDIYLD